MKVIKFFLGFIVLCLFTMFSVSNNHTTFLKPFFNNESIIPVYLLVYCSFAVGFIFAWILSLGMMRSLKKNLKQLTRINKEQETELLKLRNLPVSTGKDRAEKQETDKSGAKKQS